MRALTFAAVVFLASSLTGEAQDQKFPYEAVVVEDGVYIRSGAGKSKYPTGRLAKGQRVRVHRHDPGGWFSITPPKGSFSWIAKKNVRVIRQGLGEVIGDGTVAFVGTEFGSGATVSQGRIVFQRRMSVGEEVQILGEGQIELDGPEAMWKITPPRREYRWIPGRAVVAANKVGAASPPGRDPFGTVEPVRPQPKSTGNRFLGERPGSARRTNNRQNVVVRETKTRIDPARLNADRARLDALDADFRAIIKRPKSEWEFTNLQNGYLQLQQNAAHPALASQVNLRLPALKRYQRTKDRYDEFASLTSATTQRDRQLTRMSSGANVVAPPATEILPPPPGMGNGNVFRQPPPQQPSQPRQVAMPVPQLPAIGDGNGGQSFQPPASRLPQTGPIVPETPANALGVGGNQKAGYVDPMFDPPGETPAVKRYPVPPGMTRVPQRNPDFAGAGIIQVSTDLDVPKHVLLTPSGKILAYLEGVDGFDLSRHVAFAMGIKGDRFHSPKLQADLIKVRGVKRIQLLGERQGP